MSKVTQGGQIVLSAQFYQYLSGPPFDPTNPTVTVTLDGVTVAGPFNYPQDIIRLNLGSYAYTWTVPINAVLGTYVAKWQGTIFGNLSTGDEFFNVVPGGFISTSPSDSASFLDQDFELVFFNDLEPMLVDPDEIVKIISDTSVAEASEYINFYSREAEEILATNADPVNDTFNLTWTATAYVKAATICALNKIYSISDAEELNMMLGDLTISARNHLTDDPTRANATTWCALAEVLRQELERNRAKMKAIMRGSNFRNPIPRRRLKRLK